MHVDRSNRPDFTTLVPVETLAEQRWAMRAQAAGYPLCRDCQEPIERRLWKTHTRCAACLALESDLRIQRILPALADVIGIPHE